jgi:NitT/TauT family transport system permease protein
MPPAPDPGKSRRLLWLAASFAVAFGGWEAVGRWPLSAAFPPFSATCLAFGRMLADGSLAKAYAITAQPLLVGFALCGVVGVGFGVWMGLSRTVEWFSLPVFIILQAAPMGAVVPLVTYIYGIGLTAKVLAVVAFASPVIVMNSYKGIRNTPPSLLQMCRAFLGTPAQVVVKIILPHAAAMIFTGLRLGLAMGFIGVVVAELLITPTGIGDLITYHSSVAEFPEMFAAVGSIVLLASLTVHALERLERRLFPPDVRGS